MDSRKGDLDNMTSIVPENSDSQSSLNNSQSQSSSSSNTEEDKQQHYDTHELDSKGDTEDSHIRAHHILNDSDYFQVETESLVHSKHKRLKGTNNTDNRKRLLITSETNKLIQSQDQENVGQYYI